MLNMKGVRHDEATVKPFIAGESIRLGYESDIKVDSDEFDPLAEGACGSEPPKNVPGPASDVDDAYNLPVAAVTKRCDKRLKKFRDAAAVLKFLGDSLHLAMNANEQIVHRRRIKYPVTLREALNDAHSGRITHS